MYGLRTAVASWPRGRGQQVRRGRRDPRVADNDAARETLALSDRLIEEMEAADLIVEEGRVAGIRLADGSEVRARAVVLTTGTFLNGVIHVGDRSRPGGRVGEPPSRALAGVPAARRSSEAAACSRAPESTMTFTPTAAAIRRPPVASSAGE